MKCAKSHLFSKELSFLQEFPIVNFSNYNSFFDYYIKVNIINEKLYYSAYIFALVSC